MLNKRGKIIGILVIVVGLLLAIAFFLSSSSAVSEIKTNYVLGEKVQFSFSEKVQYSLKISSPEGEFIKKGTARQIDYLPSSAGDYSLLLTYSGRTERYSFKVFKDLASIPVESNAFSNELSPLSNSSLPNNSLEKVSKSEVLLGKNKKEVRISSGVVQTNVQENISLQLPVLPKDKSRIKVKNIDSGELVSFESTDLNADGYLDMIQLTIPYVFGVQTYEVIIEITNAEHLDENRNLIEDIYSSVEQRDEVWSPEILENQFVRVNFEKNLTSQNDITLVPKIISGKPSIEIYEKESDVKIAEFVTLNNNATNKLFLTNLIGEQDTFDLKIIGGSVSFDYITDPYTNYTYTYDYTQDGIFTVPSGVTSIVVEAWGGGGVGGGARGNRNSGGGGGAGGQYAKRTISVSPGQEFTIDVASATVHPGGNNVDGPSGASTSFYNGTAVYVLAVGGAGGVNAAGTRAGGLGTNASGIGDLVYAGGSGAAGTTSASGGGGGGAGSTAAGKPASGTTAGGATTENGGAGGTGLTTSANGNPGNNYAGGGSGARRATLGGSGAAGYMRIKYEQFTPIVINVQSPTNGTGYTTNTIWFNATANDVMSKWIANYNGTNITLSNINTSLTVADGNYNLKLYANDSRGVWGLNNSIYFRVDTTPPIVSVSSPIQNNYYNVSTVWFNLSTNENSTANYTLTNGATNYTMTANATSTGFSDYRSLSDGNYNVSFYVADIYGNKNFTQYKNFTIDTQNPNISFTTNTAVDYANLSQNWIFANISLNETNFLNITFNLYNATSSPLNSTTYTSLIKTINWTGLSAGTYLYNVTVYDKAKNKNSTETRQITLDYSAPSLTLVYPQNITYNTTSLSINYSVSDSAIHSCWYTNNSGATNYSLPSCQNISYSASQNSTTIRVYVNDSAGNLNSSTVTFFVDSIVPQIAFTTGTENNDNNFSRSWIFANISLNETNLVNLSFNLFNSLGVPVSSYVVSNTTRQVNWTGLSDGVYFYNASVIDIANNTNKTETRKIRLDTAGPVVMIDSPKPILYITNISLPLNFTVYDEGSGILSQCWWSLNGSANQTIDCASNLTFNTSEGIHILYLYSNDSLGNVGSSSVQFTVDLNVPSVELVSPVDLEFLDTEHFSSQFDYLVNDKYGLANCSLYGSWGGWGLKQSNQSPIVNHDANSFMENLAGYPDGNYTWNVECYNINNMNAMSFFNNSFTIDDTTPEISFTTGTEDSGVSVSQNWISVNLSVTETNTKNITFNLFDSLNNSVNSSSFNELILALNWTGLDEGIYYYNVTIYDKTNHVNSTETRQIDLNYYAPAVSINSPMEKTYGLQDFPILVSISLDEEADSVLFTTDEWQTNYTLSKVSDWIYEGNISSLSDGFYTLRVFANDTLNNINNSVYVDFSVDTTPPIVNVTSPIQDYYYNISSVWFNLSTNENSTANYTLTNGATNYTMTANATSTGFSDYRSLSDGNYNVSFYVADIYGNKNFTQYKNFTIDTQNPNISFIEPTPEDDFLTSSDFVTINVSVFDFNLDSVILEWNGVNESFDSYAGESYWSTKSSLSDGIYIYRAYVIDKAGNVNLTEQRMLNIDLNAPEYFNQNQTREGVLATKFYRGEILNLSANWTDNFELSSAILSTNETGTFENKTSYDSPQNISGITNISWFNWSNNSVVLGTSVGWKVYVNDSVGHLNVTDIMAFQVWGYSEIFLHTLNPTGMQANQNTTMTCAVRDNVTHEAIPNYNVSFYKEGVYLGSNFTDVNGYTSLKFSESTEGTYNIVCNITDDNSKYYTASGNNQASDLLGVGFKLTTYSFLDYTNNKAYEGIDVNSLSVYTEIDDLYFDLFSNNTIYQDFRTDTASQQGQYARSRFEFKINENATGITNLSLIWTGRGQIGTGTAGYNISVYNYSLNGWQQLAAVQTTAHASVIHNFSSGVSQLINSSGYLKIMAQSYNPSATTGGGSGRWVEIDSDYLYVSVYSDVLPPTVNLTAPVNYFNTSAIQTDFKCYADDNFQVKNVTLYGNWSTGWHANQTDSSGLRAVNYTFSKNLSEGVYSWNCFVCDVVGNCEFASSNRTISVDRTAPNISLLYPVNNFNFTGQNIPSFNFSVTDNILEIVSCKLYGNWSTGWHNNATLTSIQKGAVTNFTGVNVSADNYYTWNVNCTDYAGNSAFNSTNFTFSAFYPTEKINASSYNLTQSSLDGTGNVVLHWNATPHADKYVVYSSNSLTSPFVYLNETKETNYTDTSANQQKRRFYKVSAWNPISENVSQEIFGKTVYSLQQKIGVNTRNWVNLYIDDSNVLNYANDTLASIPNATTLAIWNETIQRRVKCTAFLCPSYPECTETDCNFNFSLSDGRGYEVYVNSSAPVQYNWSVVGVVSINQSNISLVKNSTSFGKNWVGLATNTSLVNAQGLISNISYAEAVTNWDSVNQVSQGYVKSPFPVPPYLGANFVLELEKAYEVSVTQSSNWTRV